MERLKDKVAIITGGAAGIGKSTAALFLKEGASVMLVDINKENLESTSKELDSQHLAYCVADVSNPADVERYTAETLSKFGKINLFQFPLDFHATSRDWHTNVLHEMFLYSTNHKRHDLQQSEPQTNANLDL